MISIEDQEFHDWKITPEMDNIARKNKSIEAYWLNKWYQKMENITFKTYFYNTFDEIPDILPFDKSMVRYENKSPKDSEFWSHCNSKEQMKNIFYTSLRCKTNPGNIYCIREWIDLGEEYRCFWNGKLVAISSEMIDRPPIEDILNYIRSISEYICFHKCVFDISQIKNSNKFIFVEYNSWETNSGAHRFDWIYDTEVFYETNCITIRWKNGEEKISPIKNIQNIQNIIPKKNLVKFESFDDFEIVKQTMPCNYLLTDKFFYLTTDIWLGRFTLNLKPINWKRGVFRFTCIELCDDGSLFINPNYYYPDLTPKKSKSILSNTQNIKNINKTDVKYGFFAINKKTNKLTKFVILESCEIFILS